MKVKSKMAKRLTYLKNLVGDNVKKIRLAVSENDIDKIEWIRLGFNENLENGDYIIPSVIGKFTEFNANGREKIRKDLPKEDESFMVHATTRDWHGGLHSSVQTRSIKKYPREFVSPPSEALQVIQINDTKYISTSEIELDNLDDTKNIHLNNLMSECFSEFEIINVEKNSVIPSKMKRLQWDILPKGKYPWNVSKVILEEATLKLNEKDKEVINHRMRIISNKIPDFLATGRGGFSGYFVYGFESKNIYILESVHLDNATYVFNSDWESLSKLTKNDIINSDISHERIIHNGKWSMMISRIIDAK